jgi:hypothetical protein
MELYIQPQTQTACTRDYNVEKILFHCKKKKIYKNFDNFVKFVISKVKI